MAKAAMLRHPLSNIPLLLAPELCFSGLWVLLGILPARRLPSAWLRALWALLFALASAVLLVLFVVDLGFFLKTGTALDGFMLRYGWKQRRELWSVLRSELDPVSTTALLLGPWIPALPALSGLARTLRDRLRRLDERIGPAPVYLSIAIAALGLLGLFTSSADDAPLGTLRTSPPQALFQATLQGLSWHNRLEATPPPPPSFYAPRRLERNASAPRQPLNVVLVVLESTRASSTTVHAPQLKTTPFLASLARQGRWAERMYTVIPHTSKALVGILCSLTPWPRTPILEAQGGPFPGGCLATLLRREGYATAFFQTATATFEQRAALIENAGFEDFFERDDMPPNFHRSSYFGYEDRAMLGPALDWVARHRTRPFLLTLLTLTSHHNYVVPRGFPRRDFGHQGHYESYLNTLRYVDDFLREVHHGFARMGLLDRTVFVVVGDHGEGFGEHGRYQHDNTIYEEGIHVPFVVAGPGVPSPGRPIRGLRQITDVMPSILELLGYRIEGGRLDGRSVFSSPWRQAVHVACWYHDYCMARVTERRKFVYHYWRRPPEVFDLTTDPFERHDLRARGEVPRSELVSSIESLRRWKREADRWWRHIPERAADRDTDRRLAHPHRSARGPSRDRRPGEPRAPRP